MSIFETFLTPLQKMWDGSLHQSYVEHLYSSIVVQSRLPVFYEYFEVPDTPEGRFDMISLHMALIMRHQKKHQCLSQELFDLFFTDIDQNLREMGVGDLKVGREVKKMARNFYGVLEAYDRALTSGLSTKGEPLSSILTRNLYGGEEKPEILLKSLEIYIKDCDRVLAAVDLEKDLPHWPHPALLTAL